MMVRQLFLCIALFATSSAHADAYKVSGLDIGTVFRFASSAGNARITYRGPDQGLFLFHYERDGSQGAATNVRNWTDAFGRTKVVVENGNQLRFSPHDCWLVEGRCRFTVTNSDGEKFRMTQIGSLNGDTFTYELKNTRNTVERGRVVVDSFGMPLERRFETADGKAHWTKRK